MLSTERIEELIHRWQDDDDEEAANLLFEALRDDFKRLGAGVILRRARNDKSDTFSASDLVQETYLTMNAMRSDVSWRNLPRFRGLVAKAMDRIVREHIRKKSAQKRGGDLYRVPLDDVELAEEDRGQPLAEISKALDALEEMNSDAHVVFVLRYFGGLTQKETAAMLGIAVPTVARRWKDAQNILRTELRLT